MLIIKDVNKKLGDFNLKNINLELKQGFILGLIGVNGGGKTSLIKLIMNIISPDSGNIEIFGIENLRKNNKEIKDKIGFVLDEFPFKEYPHLTLSDICDLFKKVYSNFSEKEFLNLVKELDFPLYTKVKNMSKGQLSKAQIALALCHKAELIVMDEPSSGLDPLVRRKFLALIRKYVNENNASAIFSTHITEDLEGYADYISIIDDGRIIKNLMIEDLNDYKVVNLEKNSQKNIEDFSLIGKEDKDFYIEGLAYKIEADQNVNVRNANLVDLLYYYHRSNHEK
ncbi:ABC-2 type transport system ATP-binding protein [Peptoniphilus koenoeneniae]|uniref:ABC-2 type transport system ATP-binding protein n=1 Tax=Peptoniphilus koenoeneniae TaxID=507751 RepID=A0ABU0AU07_9FIRM|nr:MULTISPECIES: ABC transporter ATP-binding protein [Peptoniphilus]ERT59005.1 ABC transporter, ATP-binding protein [Peptoniphilus sp. BV3C26]MDQ0274485.1 ABC-2 type transport system ATP-binding protein [Peptoniphilus koenoeneniae]